MDLDALLRAKAPDADLLAAAAAVVASKDAKLQRALLERVVERPEDPKRGVIALAFVGRGEPWEILAGTADVDPVTAARPEVLAELAKLLGRADACESVWRAATGAALLLGRKDAERLLALALSPRALADAHSIERAIHVMRSLWIAPKVSREDWIAEMLAPLAGPSPARVNAALWKKKGHAFDAWLASELGEPDRRAGLVALAAVDCAEDVLVAVCGAVLAQWKVRGETLKTYVAQNKKAVRALLPARSRDPGAQKRVEIMTRALELDGAPPREKLAPVYEARAPVALAAPELASLATWRKATTAERARVAADLASALGPRFKVASPTGAEKLARVRDTKFGLSYVAVPGGALKMGLSTTEARELTAAGAAAGEDRAMLKKLVSSCGRQRTVAMSPFLMAETPLLESHLEHIGVRADTANAHRVACFDRSTAAQLVEQGRLALPTEAQWEWVARAGGARSWLSGAAPPEQYVAKMLAAKKLDADDQPFGVRGLAWGCWVSEGRRAPSGARGGALALYPWQGAEVVMMHAAFRDGDHGGAIPFRPVLPLACSALYERRQHAKRTR